MSAQADRLIHALKEAGLHAVLGNPQSSNRDRILVRPLPPLSERSDAMQRVMRELSLDRRISYHNEIAHHVYSAAQECGARAEINGIDYDQYVRVYDTAQYNNGNDTPENQKLLEAISSDAFRAEARTIKQKYGLDL